MVPGGDQLPLASEIRQYLMHERTGVAEATNAIPAHGNRLCACCRPGWDIDAVAYRRGHGAVLYHHLVHT